MTTSKTRAAALCALLATTCLAFPGSADAESKLINTPADKYVIAPGGVDMRTGRYVYNETDLSIGGSEPTGGLALNRTMSNYVANHANPFGNFSHNWDIMLLETRVDLGGGNPVGSDYRMNVHFGGRSFTFESNQAATGYAYRSDGPSAFLTFAGGTKDSASVVYTLRGPDGTIMVFRPIGGEDCANEAWGSGRRRCAFISELTQPDGTKYTFDYAYNGAASGNRARLRQVTSSRGYAVRLEGSGNAVTKACVLNFAQTPASSVDLCPSNALAVASYSYVGGKLGSVTRPDGAIARFTYSTTASNGVAMGFTKPGQSTPWLTNNITLRIDEENATQETIDSQTFSDGQSYTYTYDLTPFANNKPHQTIVGGRFVDAEGRTTKIKYGFPILPGTGATTPCDTDPCTPREPFEDLNATYQQTPGPIAVTDPLGRNHISGYCDPDALAGIPPTQRERCFVIPLQWFTDPEGVKTSLKYDAYRNIIEVRQTAKQGPGLPDIVTSAAYDTTRPKSATKPLWIKDANGNITEYTYAPEHGGELTETGPAVNGIRPQTRHEYAQRYARLSNGTGGYVPAASPVWLRTATSMCRTSAATGNPASPCAVPGDEVRTTYDYGPDTGPNNLLLRGTVITADGQSLRTCQSYDARGNKISETGAGANLSTCQ